MLKKISQTTLLQAINVSVPFLTIPWYVNKLSVSGYGQIGAALALMQILQLFVDYGFTLTAARNIAKSNDKLIEGSQLFSDIILIKILIFLLCLAIVTLSLHIIKVQPELENLIQIGFILVLGQALTPTWLYLGRHESSKLMILTILPKTLMVPVIFLTIRENSDLTLAMFLNVIPYFITGILCISMAIKANLIRFEKPNFSRMKKEIIVAFPLFKSSIATSVSTSLTPIILNGISGPHALGIYLIADKIRQGIQSILTPISVVAYPKITEELSSSQDQAFYTIKMLGIYMLILAALITLTVSIFSNEILAAIFGNSAIEAENSLRILMLVTMLTFCNTIISTYIMIPLGRDKVYSKIIVYTSLLHLALMWPFVSEYSHIGASIVLTISEFCLLCLMVRYLLTNSSDSGERMLKTSILYRLVTSQKIS